MRANVMMVFSWITVLSGSSGVGSLRVSDPFFAVPAEQGSDAVVSFLDGDIDGRSPSSSSSIQLGTGFQQCFDDFDVAPRSGPHQRGETALTLGVRVRTRFK
jgi:hypothetical protein